MSNPFKDIEQHEEPQELSPKLKSKVNGSYQGTKSIFKTLEIVFGKMTEVLIGIVKLFDATYTSHTKNDDIDQGND